jgi:hypothetical protein
MPDFSALSLAGAKLEALDGQTRLINAVLHLFKSGFVPSPTSPLSAFLDQECDFDNYAPKTIAAWADPVLAEAAYVIYAPTQTFPWAHVADDVGNQVGGAFLVTAGGVLYSYTVFDPTRPCQGPDQAVISTQSDVYPAG